jgi:hypothetical protein
MYNDTPVLLRKSLSCNEEGQVHRKHVTDAGSVARKGKVAK